LHLRLITELGELINDAAANDTVCGASSGMRDTVAHEMIKNLTSASGGKLSGRSAGRLRRRGPQSRHREKKNYGQDGYGRQYSTGPRRIFRLQTLPLCASS
jgi:hypothetical protein